MSEFTHSCFLFMGDDGLPLEFNVRNTEDKEHLKEVIEYGGGICTQDENAVHLISPGTKVLNSCSGKKLVSSTYIYDCVKENELLDVNDYVFTISEAQTSDISDEDSERLLALRHSTCKPLIKSPQKSIDISPIRLPKINETGSSTASNLTIPTNNSSAPQASLSSSSHSESFIEGTQGANSIVKIMSHVYTGNLTDDVSKSPEIIKDPIKLEDWELTDGQQSPSLVSPVKSSHTEKTMSICSMATVSDCSNKDSSPISVIKSPFKLPLQIGDQNSSLKATDSGTVRKNVIVSPKSVSMELDDSLLKPDMKKEALVSLFSKSNLTDEHQNVSMDIDKSVTQMSVKRSLIFQSPNKSEEESLLQKDTQAEIDSPAKNTLISGKTLSLQSAIQPGKLALPMKTATVLTENIDENIPEVDLIKSPVVVTSSQPEEDLDNFDNMLLSKIQGKQQDEESLSQSNTVSSSADAQVSSKPCSMEISSEDKNNASLPDSPSLSTAQVNVQMYVKHLEEEVQEILRKGTPLTLQEKANMVKYICCTRELSPSEVLGSLLNNSLEL